MQKNPKAGPDRPMIQQSKAVSFDNPLSKVRRDTADNIMQHAEMFQQAGGPNHSPIDCENCVEHFLMNVLIQMTLLERAMAGVSH